MAENKLAGPHAELYRCVEKPRLRWRWILAGGFLTLAYVGLSLYPGNAYAKRALMAMPDNAAGRRVENSTGSDELTATTKGDLMETSAWNPFHRRCKPDLPRILFWTTVEGSWYSNLQDGNPNLQTTGCPDLCYITNDRRNINTSDAVVFYGVDLKPSLMPQQRAAFQKWVFWSLEPPWHTPVDTFKNLKETFNWTFTYRLDSDILDAYGNVTLKKPGIKKYTKDTLKRIWRNKTKMAAWAVSKCNTSGKREDYVRELQKHMLVDVHGKCGDKVCLPIKSDKCYESFAAKYYFYLSFENCVCKDYVTEKFFRVLHHDIVPVVFGGANYSRRAPPGSFIDALSFKSPKDLALHLKNVARNFSLYSRYFEWKGEYEVKYWTYYTYCALCRKLHSDSFKEKSVVPDLLHWWNSSSNCRAFSKDTNTFYE